MSTVRWTSRPILMGMGLTALLVAWVLGVAPADGSTLGAGCDDSRPADVHRAGGAPASAERDRVPCATETGFYTGETTIAVTQAGTVWFSAADWEWALVRSDDQGASWERYAVPGPQAYPGCPGHTMGLSPLQCDNSQSAKNNTVADAFLYVDPVTDRLMWSKTYGYATCSSMNTTGDNGDTWQAVTQFACPGGDYEKIASGPAPAGTDAPTGDGHVYYTCTNGPAPTFVVGPTRICYKSLDSGQTWSATGSPVTPHPDAPGCLHFQEPMAVAQDGAAFEGRAYQPLGCSALIPDNPDGNVRVAISDDQMATWRYVVVPDGGVGSTAGLFGGVSLAVDDAGHVYVVWTGADARPYLSVSADGGETWMGPMDIGKPGVTVANPSPQVAAGADGQIAVAYYGFEAGGSAATLNGYITESFDAASGDPLLYSSILNDPDDPLYFPTDGGSLPRNDYLGVTIAPDGTPWTALVKLLSPAPDGEGFVQSTGFAGRTVWDGE